jgi:hypothetical protein
MIQTALSAIQRRWLLFFLGLLGVLAILLWLSPAEQTLGQSIKLVYLHGALVRTALLLLAISLPVNLIALFSGKANWFGWGRAITLAAIIIWLAHTLVSMITTYATWGVFIAWFEPRTRFTFNLAFVGVIVLAASRLVDSRVFSAMVNVLLAAIALFLLPGLGFVQHPLDPIGQSTSGTIQFFYAAILGISLMMGGLLVIWLQARLAFKTS